MKRVLLWFGCVVLLGVLLVSSGCRGCNKDRQSSVWKKIDIGAPTANPTPEQDIVESPAPAPEPKQAVKGFQFEFSPKMLRVYRPTQVTFWVSNLPPGERPTKIEWRFDDELTRHEGEEIKFTFEGGLRDRNVTATLHYPSGREVRVVRTVPLEKIPVLEAREKGPARTVPQIDDYTNGLRVAFIGKLKNNAALAEKVQKVLEVEPHILFVMGDFGSAGKGTSSDLENLRTGLVDPVVGRGIWLCPILGEGDVRGAHKEKIAAFWSEHSPPLDLVAGSDYPRSYSFRRDGVFFTTISSGYRSSDEEILRLQSVLGRGQGDPSRVVASHFPLAPFTEKDDGHLEKAYRFYEVMERSGVAAMVSGHYGVTYLGQYGGLKAFSAGHISGECDLLPTGQCTPEAVVVLDFSRGKLKRAFAVELGPLTVYRTDELPSVLFNYRRWDPKLR